MQVDLYNKEGQTTGTVELTDSVFAIEPNENAMHQSIVAHLAHNRQGTRKTKVRSEVSGGGKKPWKQKGRGTARAGSTRSPIWVGGGTIHGPQPHDFKYTLPKKLNKLSRKSAYSVRVNEAKLKVVQDFSFDEIKTKDMASIIDNFNLKGQSTLIITNDFDNKVNLSSRNIKKLQVRTFDRVSTYDLLSHKNVLLMQGAIEKIENSFK